MPTLVDQLKAAQLPSTSRRRSIRLDAGASLRDVGTELGVHPMTVLKWENGDSVPRRAHAIAYRELLERLAAVSS